MLKTYKIEAVNTLTDNPCTFRVSATSPEAAKKIALAKNPKYLKIVSATVLE